MAKALKYIYPGLRSRMAFKGEGVEELAMVLGLSNDSVRRRLSGRSDFELSEIKKLIVHYECSFNDLFELQD